MFIIIRYDGVDGGTKDATVYDKQTEGYDRQNETKFMREATRRRVQKKRGGGQYTRREVGER